MLQSVRAQGKRLRTRWSYDLVQVQREMTGWLRPWRSNKPNNGQVIRTNLELRLKCIISTAGHVCPSVSSQRATDTGQEPNSKK